MKKQTILMACFIFTLLGGCASKGSYTLGGAPVTNMLESLEKGEIRLKCELSCSGAYGGNRRKMKKLYDNELWRDLAFTVSDIGFQSDQSYYYLGRAAEGLGYNDAAITYYKLAKTAFKCGGLLNVCDGFVFPRDINSGLNRLQIAMEEAREREETKAKEEIRGREAAKVREETKDSYIVETLTRKNETSLATPTEVNEPNDAISSQDGVLKNSPPISDFSHNGINFNMTQHEIEEKGFVCNPSKGKNSNIESKCEHMDMTGVAFGFPTKDYRLTIGPSGKVDIISADFSGRIDSADYFSIQSKIQHFFPTQNEVATLHEQGLLRRDEWVSNDNAAAVLTYVSAIPPFTKQTLSIAFRSPRIFR